MPSAVDLSGKYKASPIHVFSSPASLKWRLSCLSKIQKVTEYVSVCLLPKTQKMARYVSVCFLSKSLHGSCSCPSFCARLPRGADSNTLLALCVRVENVSVRCSWCARKPKYVCVLYHGGMAEWGLQSRPECRKAAEYILQYIDAMPGPTSFAKVFGSINAKTDEKVCSLPYQPENDHVSTHVLGCFAAPLLRKGYYERHMRSSGL